jgi:hypothetical protein
MQSGHSDFDPLELLDMGRPMKVELMEVWRDKALAGELRSEIKRQAVDGWKPWEILLPPALLWPMLEEVSSGMTMTWTPVLFDIGVQVGREDEVAIRFILPGLKTSPAMVKAMPYRNPKATVPVEVGHGDQV